MPESISNRLARLESQARRVADRCPACGANWPGSTYIAIELDGTETSRCIRCQHPRALPFGNVKAMGASIDDGPVLRLPRSMVERI